MATETQTCAIGILQATNNEQRNEQCPFMQNKPNLPAPQMNVGSVKTKDYESRGRLQTQAKQTQSNPIS